MSIAADTMEHDAMDPQLSHEDHLNSNGEIEPSPAQCVSCNANVLAAVVSHDSDRVNLDPALFEQAQTDGANGNGNIGNSKVKDEPMDDAGDIDWAFSGKEAINLCSDDEEDTTPQSNSRPPPRLRSPFAPQPRTTREDSGDDLMANDALNGTNGKSHEIAEPDASKANDEAEKAGPGARGISLGQSILQTKKPGVDLADLQAKKLQAQKDMAVRFREQQKAKAAAKGGDVPKGGSGEESMRVTPVEQLDDVPEEPPPVQKPRGRGGRGKKPKDNAAITFGKLKSIYDRKKRAGTASIHDDIEFMKIESEEAARLRKLQADEDFDRTPSPEPEDDEGVFVSQDEAEIPSYRDQVSDDDDEVDEGPKRSRKRKNAADSDDETLKQNKARKGAGRPKASGNSQKKPKKVPGTNYAEGDPDDVLFKAKRAAAGHKLKKAAAAPTSKTKATSKKKTGPTMTNITSIVSTDVFADTAKVAGLANQPMFDKAGRRPDALKQLIASVPTESKKIAQVDKRYLDEAIKAFTGHGTVRASTDGNWTVKGMISSLKHYQILGVAFMRKRENDSNEPRGGILADQMGLGKTVMMLANIVNGKPKPGARVRTTLIVASPALVTQWYAEVTKHCHDFRSNKKVGIGKVIIYKAGNRMMSNADEEILSQHDIVLTTYHEIARSYPKATIPTNLVTSTQKDAWWKTHYEQERGLLHRMKFLRIVLDEAQAIKNHKGHTSMACRAVDARFHWAITGTPILNTVREFYPYFKFLREPNTGSYKIFKENFCSPDDPDGAEKLNVFLRKFMIRRTHIDTLFNARLLDLPQPKEHTLWLEFNEVERQIYEIVKKRFIQRINSIAKVHGLERQYNHIWTMILRLRQICGHILLVQGTIIDLLEREDFEKLNRITEAEDQMSDEGSSLLMHLRNVLRNNHGVKQIEAGLGNAVVFENETLPTGVIDVEEAEGKTGGKHGLSFRFRKYMESLVQSEAWDVITQRTLCSGCRQPPNDPHVTSCFHIYCLSCLNDLQHFAARKGYDAARCGECGEAYNNVQKCENWETFSVRESTKGSSEAGDEAPAPQRGPRPKKKKKKEDELPDWIGMAGEVLPSAKTMAVKAQVMEWLDEDKTAKIIIYSQFLPMIRILGKICQTEGWGYCKYTGTMSHESRNKAIQEFGEKEEKVIMLASLKCGGLGLNLTMASRVIQLDPWWNAAVEQQAFCRVFRIGQQKETRMTRFVVKNTIDAAMMAMKERKQIEIDEVMDDSKRKEKLSVDDLMRLFGPVDKDSEGKPFIFAEGADQYDDGDPEHMRLPNVDSDDEEQMMGNEE